MQVLESAAQISFSPLLRRYSIDEFWALPEPADRSHYDLIGGQLFMVPPPDPPHGNIDFRLADSLFEFVRSHKIAGEVHHPREGIYTDFAAATYVEPDMMYVTNALRDRMGNKRCSADIVFEYLSPSTATYDRTTKADTYLALGVRELWLIDPVTVSIEVRYATVREGRPEWETWRFSRGDWAESRVLPGWRVSVDELFKGLT